jgi:superfamily II DNA/RNA helicase
MNNNSFVSSDLTFFTNEPNQTLLNRFNSTLKGTQFFDVLVGYFCASGFYQLYESMKDIEKIRILVGLTVDKDAWEIMQINQENGTLDIESHQRTKYLFQKNLIAEIEESTEDDNRLEKGVRKFVEFLHQDCTNQKLAKSQLGNGKKLEIRAYPSKNIHAKVYIKRYNEKIRDIQYGSVITGSSNFSESGLVARREFNVELKNRTDVDFALKQFEDLWKESVDISEDFIDATTKKTWLNDSITPYELYLKCIYEYLEEDINLEDEYEPFLPPGFMDLRYQRQAATGAKKILETYNGVFLADVVGLGKTFITAMLLQQLQGHILVICPPVLKEYWEESLRDFGVRSHKVESIGKLDHILKKDISKYKYVVVDEAHRFRNEATQSYADLIDICRGKKVILVTATPLNNTVDDIFAQLKLFQPPKNSTIPGVPNLENFFNKLKRKLRETKPTIYYDDAGNKYTLPEEEVLYKNTIKEVSDTIRDKVLKFVMVRRTRTDVKTFFKDDMQKQEIVFPEVDDPGRIIYNYKGNLEKVFNQTIKLLHTFKYARYIPLLYYNKGLTEFEKQQQRNVGGFMKGILVKRLESSFFAFKRSVKRFITSYEKFIEMYNQGTVYISKKANVYELLANDDLETLEKLVEKEEAQKYISDNFGAYNGSRFIDDLKYDLALLKKVDSLWSPVKEDPKLEKFISDLKSVPTLKKEKLVIFTESKETGDYLYENLHKVFPGKVLFYSSMGGRHTDLSTTSKHTIAREIIKDNFDPNSTYHQNDIKYLITTDILAEGINLHRSNVLINYDLPWNPTRLLQRAGRVNRLGSKHKSICIFNFFPTSHSDRHLGLESNITNKLQMFHYIMGEDAKYLTDGEEIGSQELFNTLNSKKVYSGEEEETSELKYLEIMRGLRDSNPDLFEKIKRLPKKARSGMKKPELEKNELITFFRLGKLKKFYLNITGKSREINFFDAVERLECKPLTKRQPIPVNYFELLNINKAKFQLNTTQEQEPVKTKGGRSNAAFIERILKDKQFKNFKKFTDSDEEFLNKVKQLLADGALAKKTAQIIKKAIEKSAAEQGLIDPMKVLHILQNNIRSTAFENQNSGNSYLKREVILSGYLIK